MESDRRRRRAGAVAGDDGAFRSGRPPIRSPAARWPTRALRFPVVSSFPVLFGVAGPWNPGLRRFRGRGSPEFRTAIPKGVSSRPMFSGRSGRREAGRMCLGCELLDRATRMGRVGCGGCPSAAVIRGTAGRSRRRGGLWRRDPVASRSGASRGRGPGRGAVRGAFRMLVACRCPWIGSCIGQCATGVHASGCHRKAASPGETDRPCPDWTQRISEGYGLFVLGDSADHSRSSPRTHPRWCSRSDLVSGVDGPLREVYRGRSRRS